MTRYCQVCGRDIPEGVPYGTFPGFTTLGVDRHGTVQEVTVPTTHVHANRVECDAAYKEDHV